MIGEAWTAIILAGQRPGVDPLAAHFGETWKALVRISGEPMLTRVIRTVAEVPNIERRLILAQMPEVLTDAVAHGGGGEMIASQSGISASILSLCETQSPWPVLVTTADHPLLTADMIGHFLEQAQNCDVAIAMVERDVVRGAYPDNQRTWLKFRDGHWSGANLFALRTPKAENALRLWAEAEQDRKKAWKLFLHFGPWLAFRALTRTIGLAEGLVQAGNRLGLSVKLVAMPWAEAAIDVDKPSDHILAETILAARAAD
jgi:GTP:adenosylcobinamide-phosphate guanylyltransferase